MQANIQDYRDIFFSINLSQKEKSSKHSTNLTLIYDKLKIGIKLKSYSKLRQFRVQTKIYLNIIKVLMSSQIIGTLQT